MQEGRRQVGPEEVEHCAGARQRHAASQGRGGTTKGQAAGPAIPEGGGMRQGERHSRKQSEDVTYSAKP